jgi:hypothetical protein
VGRRLAVGNAADGIHQRLAEVARLVKLHVVDHHLFLALAQGFVDAVAQALHVGGSLEAVDHKLNGVVAVAVEFHAVGDLEHLSVDSDVEVAFLAEALEQFLVVSLAVFDKRDPAVGVALRYEAYDLLVGVFDHRLARNVAARLSGACVEQSEEVVDLGGGAYGASRIAVDGLLFDGYDRVEACDLVDVGAFERSEHVAGVG